MTGTHTAALSPFPARVAGTLYLVIIIAGICGEPVVRSRLLATGDTAATAENIPASEALFRSGFAAGSVMLLCDVAVAVLLKPASKVLPLIAAAFRLAQTANWGQTSSATTPPCYC